MRILGIDPGIGRTGYAVLDIKNNQTKLLEAGCITTIPGEADPKRLAEIRKDLNSIIKKYKPSVCAVETLYFTTNAKTAMKVGQARGVILVTAAEHKLQIIEITPLQVKMATTGYGKADKRQVQTMIKKLLDLKKIPKPDDAADAAAIAWAGIPRIKKHIL
jgi:crossover junction endodeoxyribonuclease RuvC